MSAVSKNTVSIFRRLKVSQTQENFNEIQKLYAENERLHLVFFPKFLGGQ